MPSLISMIMADFGVKNVSPRHVEAFMRDKHGVLDALSRRRFRNEVLAAVACVMHDQDLAEKLAQSFGL